MRIKGTVTLVNVDTGVSESMSVGPGNEDDIRYQLKELGQMLESGDAWFELSDPAKLAPPVKPAPSQYATPRLLRYLQAIAREAGMAADDLDERAVIEFGVPAAALTRRDCSTLINLIQSSAKR